MRKSRSLGYSYSYFSQSMGDSFPSDSYPMAYFIPWKMLRSSHQYPISWGKAIKPILYEEPRKLVPIVFPRYGCFCSTRFLSYGMLHYMENTWVFPSISHRMGKSTDQREPRKLIPKFFRKYAWFSSIRFPSYGLLHKGNTQVFPTISHSIGKGSKPHIMGRAREIGTSTFPKA